MTNGTQSEITFRITCPVKYKRDLKSHIYTITIFNSWAELSVQSPLLSLFTLRFLFSLYAIRCILYAQSTNPISIGLLQNS